VGGIHRFDMGRLLRSRVAQSKLARAEREIRGGVAQVERKRSFLMALASFRSVAAAAGFLAVAVFALAALPAAAEPAGSYPLYAGGKAAVSAGSASTAPHSASAASDPSIGPIVRNETQPHAVRAGVRKAGEPAQPDSGGAGAAVENAELIEPVIAPLPCAPATAEPLDAILRRLDERRSYARRWWMGFTGFYGLGTLVTAYQAADEDDAGKRAVDIVSSVKAAFGTTRLLFDRPAALYGGVPVRRELPDCDAALAKGEELMRRAAKETRSRASWKRHLSIVGINAAGALVAGEGWGERGKAWTSAGIGVVVGEIMAWSHPWHGVEDLEEYETRFPDRRVQSTPKIRWALLPSTSGIVLRATF
jgi:hypothetical protein